MSHCAHTHTERRTERPIANLLECSLRLSWQN